MRKSDHGIVQDERGQDQPMDKARALQSDLSKQQRAGDHGLKSGKPGRGRKRPPRR